MSRLRTLVSLATALAAIVAARPAAAFCWASTCQPNGVVCEVASELDCGLPLYWPRECIGYSIQRDATSYLSYEDASWAVAAGFNVWLQPFCEGDQVAGIGLVEMQDVACDEVEYNSSAGNANLVVFRDEAWTHPDSPDKIAVTTVTFNPDTGEIYDVDIEINSALHLFTATETTEAYDLVSIVAHEAGHFFGMGHSLDWDATMFELYEPGSVEERTLTLDDQRGICAMYPPWPIDRAACNPIPRHGFASECAANQPAPSCSIRTTGTATATFGWMTLAAAILWLRRKRRG
jgi:Matrixin